MTSLGGSGVHAGSVIPPGQSGFVSQAGQEDPHFEDQLDDYINWTYKPMPLSMEELEGQTESTETIPVPDSLRAEPEQGRPAVYPLLRRDLQVRQRERRDLLERRRRDLAAVDRAARLVDHHRHEQARVA